MFVFFHFWAILEWLSNTQHLSCHLRKLTMKVYRELFPVTTSDDICSEHMSLLSNSAYTTSTSGMQFILSFISHG